MFQRICFNVSFERACIVLFKVLCSTSDSENVVDEYVELPDGEIRINSFAAFFYFLGFADLFPENSFLSPFLLFSLVSLSRFDFVKASIQ